MQKYNGTPVCKTMPFLRLLLPFIIGIILQWYGQFSFSVIIVGIICFTLAIVVFRLLPLSLRFKLQALQGILLNVTILYFGLLITWQKDIRHHADWYGKIYTDSNFLVARITEPLVEKDRSYKAEAEIVQVLKHDTIINCTGKVILYFAKDSLPNNLQYGDKILINKNLQEIKNSGNPGAFDYKRYAAFQQIFHTAYLKNKDWLVLNDKAPDLFQQFIFSSREKILNILQKNIGTDKNELGIAEALLIGYTNDLDKDLVQAYSNTGVVHIIAISGMHLALIYVMLVWIFARVPLIKRSKVLQLIMILSCLWLFSLLTGGSASVLRSAVMFSFIKCGQTFFKRSSVHNSLAASAFVLLCYDPYFLWNVGFQLSYLAVIGIIAFQRPIYNCIYVKNKWLNKIWEMAAVTIAAQALTFPICIYYFHQFPLLFLITNLIAVPLSTIILYAEIVLIAVAWIPVVGNYAGKLVHILVWLMNEFILWINRLPFAVWDRISSTPISTCLLYVIVICAAIWLINKQRSYFKWALVCGVAFTILQTYAQWKIGAQQKLIVYNVPQHRAIDCVDGNNYQFIGDSIMLVDGVLQNFHLKPARIALQLNSRVDSLPLATQQQQFLLFKNKKILLINDATIFEPGEEKMDLDIIIISKNPKLKMEQLNATFNCKQYVFDASNSLYKIGKWKNQCDSLRLPYYVVPEQGAFICDIE